MKTYSPTSLCSLHFNILRIALGGEAFGRWEVTCLMRLTQLTWAALQMVKKKIQRVIKAIPSFLSEGCVCVSVCVRPTKNRHKNVTFHSRIWRDINAKKCNQTCDANTWKTPGMYSRRAMRGTAMWVGKLILEQIEKQIGWLQGR